MMKLRLNTQVSYHQACSPNFWKYVDFSFMEIEHIFGKCWRENICIKGVYHEWELWGIFFRKKPNFYKQHTPWPGSGEDRAGGGGADDVLCLVSAGFGVGGVLLWYCLYLWDRSDGSSLLGAGARFQSSENPSWVMEQAWQEHELIGGMYRCNGLVGTGLVGTNALMKHFEI